MTNVRVTIFGGAGFVGANLAVYLTAQGHAVTCVDNLVRRGSEINLNLLKQHKVKFVHGDIRNKEDFAGLPATDIVLNAAAQPAATNYANPEFDYTNNTAAQMNVLEYCRRIGSPIILWSTNKVYPQCHTKVPQWRVKDKRYVWEDSQDRRECPYWSHQGFTEDTPLSGADHSIYGGSKAAADILTQEWCNAFQIPGIVNRFSCMSGPYQWGKAEQGWVAWFAIANVLGLPLDIFGFNGNQVRDNLHSYDLCRLVNKQICHLLAPARQQYYGEVFNVGGSARPGFSLSLNESIKIIQKKTGKEFVDIKYHDVVRRADQAIYISDTSKVEKAFLWEPTINVERTYDMIIGWVTDNKNVLEKMYE